MQWIINCISLLATTCKKGLKIFSKLFDVDLLGQVHGYLQSRLTQSANFDAAIDQNRFVKLIILHFLPNVDINNMTDAQLKRFSTPLFYDFVASKKDCSPRKEFMRRIEEEFGFEYPSVIGMLIYLMSTGDYLHLAISKLGKSNALHGRVHFKAVKHLIMHLACNCLKLGVTFYSDVKRSCM